MGDEMSSNTTLSDTFLDTNKHMKGEEILPLPIDVKILAHIYIHRENVDRDVDDAINRTNMKYLLQKTLRRSGSPIEPNNLRVHNTAELKVSNKINKTRAKLLTI